MKTEDELNKNILKITATITKKFPELVKYIEEMPVKISYTGGDEVKVKHLEKYYNSLEAILKKYSIDHTAQTK